jgi:hypothetical protein
MLMGSVNDEDMVSNRAFDGNNSKDEDVGCRKMKMG